MPNGEAGYEVMAAGFGPVKSLVESLDDEIRAAAKADLVAFFESFREGIGVAMPLDYLIAVGTRR